MGRRTKGHLARDIQQCCVYVIKVSAGRLPWGASAEFHSVTEMVLFHGGWKCRGSGRRPQRGLESERSSEAGIALTQRGEAGGGCGSRSSEQVPRPLPEEMRTLLRKGKS